MKLMFSKPLRQNQLERFLNRIDIQDSFTACWPWLAGIDKDGYGFISLFNKNVRAHRLSYYIYYGYISKEKVVCHKCDNPSCCNPHHLFLGSNTDNIKDMINKNRQSRVGGELKSRKGEQHGKAKLSEEEVIYIRQLANTEYKPSILAKKFKVSRQTIYRVRNTKNWRYV